MLPRLLLVSMMIAAPASAQSLAYVSPSLSADAALGRFYATTRTPIWLQGETLSPAGKLLVDRLRTADHEGYAAGPGLAAQVDAALATPGSAPLAIDRLLSTGWVGMVQTLQGPIPGGRYYNVSTKPAGELPDRTLFLAGRAPDLAMHVTNTLRKSRFYEDLRSAMLAEAAANGGRVDPRLGANLQRARMLPTNGRYLFVNPATAELMLVNNGVVQDKMRVVVGTAQTPTYPMTSRIYFATLNPYWNVAEDLVRKIVAPNVVKQGLGYITSRNYEVIDKYGEGATIIPAASIDWKAVLAGTQLVKMRQKPSKTNSMGKMKVPFANDFGIFLHDTVNKPQFAKSDRATSNGCIRLEDASKLARWLFGTEPSAEGTQPDQSVRLPDSVPLYVAYLTAQPSGAKIAYARDVYGLDGGASAAGSD